MVLLLKHFRTVIDANADLPVDIFSHIGRKWRLCTIECGSLPCSWPLQQSSRKTSLVEG